MKGARSIATPRDCMPMSLHKTSLNEETSSNDLVTQLVHPSSSHPDLASTIKIKTIYSIQGEGHHYMCPF